MDRLRTLKYKLQLRGVSPAKAAAASVFVVAFGIVGVLLLFSSKAATPVVSFEAEDGTQTGTSLVSDGAASAGKAIKFGSATVTPAPGLGLDPSGKTIPDTDYPVPSGAIFMASNGSDANNGTQAAPVKSLAKAIGLAPSGGTIILRAGTYRDGNTTSQSKKVTIQPYPHEKAWLDGSDVVTNWQSSGNGLWYTDWNTPSLCAGKYYGQLWNQQTSNNSGPCTHIDMSKDTTNPAAGSPQMVFVNGTYVKEVTSQSQAAGGKFYYDQTAKRLYVGFDPSGKTVELAARPNAVVFQGGSGGQTIRGIGFRKYATNEYNGNATHGAVLANAPNITFEKNVFTEMAASGVSYANAQGGVVRSNIFAKNGFNGLDANGHKATSTTVDNLIMEGNIFDGNNTERFGTGCSLSCAAAGSKMAHMNKFTLKNNIFQNNIGKGYWCDLYCKDATIVNNVFRGNTSDGLFYEVSYGGILASNVMVDNGGYGCKCGSAAIKFYNNTLVGNKTAVLMYDDSRAASGGEIAPETRNVEMANNILSGSTSTTFQNWKGQTGAEQFYTLLDYNTYYRANGQPNPLVEWRASSGTTTYNTLASFRTATKNEAHGQEVTTADNTLFVNATAGDYRIRSGSVGVTDGKPLPADVAAALGLSSAAVGRGAINWPGRL